MNIQKHISNLILAAICITAYALPLSAPAYAQDITTGLIAHWTLDETSGTTAADSSGNGLDGTMNAGLDASNDSVPGKVNSAIRFDGVDDAIEITGLLSQPQNVTLAAWVNLTATGVAGSEVISLGNNVGIRLNDFGGIQMRAFFFDGSNFPSTLYAIDLESQGWNHVSYVIDSTENTQKLFLNGVLQASDSNTNAISYTNGSDTFIGRHGNSSANYYFGGDIDDVRVYNRALSDEDIVALFDRTRVCAEDIDAGKIIYNENYRAMQYCNGDDWQSIGKGASIIHGEKTEGEDYDINAVEFEPTVDWLEKSTDLDGVVDSKIMTQSLWFRANTDKQYAFPNIFARAAGRIFTGGAFRIEGQNASGTQIIRLDASSANLNDGLWHHILYSVDLSDTGKRHIYIDDVAQSFSVADYTDDFFDHTTGSYEISRATGAHVFDGDIADYWFSTDQYIDLSIEANRRKFINADGKAINLGADGSLPTGSAPDVFLSGDTGTWHTNKGTGGGFTENGELTNATSLPPSESAKKLIGWWRFDEIEGTTVQDYSGNGNDGTIMGDLTTIPLIYGITAPNGTSIDLADTASDGRANRVEIPNVFTTGTNIPYTLSAWVKKDASAESIWGVGSAVANMELSVSRDPIRYDGSSISFFSTPIPGVWDGWEHLSFVYDGTRFLTYLNGVLEDAETQNYTLSNSTLFLGGVGGSNGSGGTDLDDVRLYNFALDADQIAELYAASNEFYKPNAVTINFGTEGDQIRATSHPSGMVPSKTATGSLWFRSIDTDEVQFLTNTSSRGQRVLIADNGAISILATNAAFTPILNFGSGTTDVNDGQWHHIAYSFNLEIPDAFHLYLDDVDLSPTASIFTNDLIDFDATGEDYKIPQNTTTANFELAEFWHDTNTYIDLSVSANRRKFTDEFGNAKFLGADGSIPTSYAPIIFFSGDSATWHVNDGTGGGGFIVNGALTDAPTAPYGEKQPRYCANPSQPEGTLIFNSDQNVMQYCDANRWVPLGPQGDGGGACSNPSGVAGMMFYNEDFKSLIYCEGDEWIGVGRDPTNDLLAEGLVGHWKLDEDSGIFADSSGNGNDGTGIGGFTYASNGIIGNATTFGGVDGHITTTDIDKSASGQITVSAWAKRTGVCTGDGGLCYVVSKAQFAGAMPYGIVYSNDLRFYAGSGTSVVSSLPAIGEWTHIVGVINGTTANLYVNGALADTNNAITPQTNNELFAIGSSTTIPTYRPFLGDIDDVRIYNRALGAGEIQSLYNLGDCPNIGDTCNDGTLYAGLSPDGDVRMFTTPEDAPGGSIYSWNDGDTNYTTTGATSGIDGDGNTIIITNTDANSVTVGSQTHVAANYCNTLNFAGHNDWYLPANLELALLTNNNTTLGLLSGPVGDLPTSYWSSSERSTDNTRATRRNSSGQGGNPKQTAINVRCVRK